MIAMLVALLLVLYKTMFVTPPLEEVTDTTAEDKINRTLNKLELMNFNLTVMQDPKFTTLKSIETPLLNLPIGRKNPFAAIFGSSKK